MRASVICTRVIIFDVLRGFAPCKTTDLHRIIDVECFQQIDRPTDLDPAPEFSDEYVYFDGLNEICAAPTIPCCPSHEDEKLTTVVALMHG